MVATVSPTIRLMARRSARTSNSGEKFGWLQAANTGLFVVYTDTRGLYDLFDRPERTDRSLVLKFSRMFDVLR